MNEKKLKIEQVIKFYNLQIKIIKKSINKQKFLLKKIEKEELKSKNCKESKCNKNS
jgi:hypothetical protein